MCHGRLAILGFLSLLTGCTSPAFNLVCVRRTVRVPHGCFAVALAVCLAEWVQRCSPFLPG